MKRILLRSILLLLVTILPAACRRELEESFYETAQLTVEIDWTASGLDPDNDPDKDLYSASLWLFAKDGTPFNGKRYKVYSFNNPRGGQIEVPVGHYSVLVFNNYFDPDRGISEFSDNVSFRFHPENPYETFEYYVKEETTTRNRFAGFSDQPSILQPDMFAAWSLDEFEVTPDMITGSPQTKKAASKATSKAGDRSIIQAYPQRMVYTCHLVVHVNNIKGAKASLGFLQGLGSSVFPATGLVSSPSAGYLFSLNNRRYDEGSSTDGTIEATFYTFGPPTGEALRSWLQLDFTLAEAYDGSTLYPTPPSDPFSFDITTDLQTKNEFYINLRIGFENPVELPRINVSSGFEVIVTDWGEEQQAEIEM